MGQSHIVYAVLVMFAAWGLGLAILGRRMPVFRHEKFLKLPADAQRAQVRRVRILGGAAGIACLGALIALILIERYLAARGLG